MLSPSKAVALCLLLLCCFGLYPALAAESPTIHVGAYEPAAVLPWQYVYWSGGAVLAVFLLLGAWIRKLHRQGRLGTRVLAAEIERRQVIERELEHHRDHFERLAATRSAQLQGAQQDAEHAATAARLGEARYRALFENILDGYAHHRAILENGVPVDYVYLDVNPAFTELTGLRDVVGKRVSELFPGLIESSPELFERYMRIAAGGGPERFEAFVDHLGMWFSITAYSPAPGEFIVLSANITERKLAEAKLAIHGKRQALLLEVASSILQSWGEKRNMARVIFDKVSGHLDADICLNYRLDPDAGNSELVAAFGISEEVREKIRVLPAEASVQPAPDCEPGCGVLQDLGARAHACHPLYSLQGTMMGHLTLASSRRDAFDQEEIEFIQTIAYFLSLAWERRRAEDQIKQLNADLERRVEERTAQLTAANRELEGFTFATSHDLKAPLGRINSFSALLENNYRDRLDGDGLLFLDFIRQNAVRLNHLVDDLLNHARVAQQDLELQPVDVGNLAEAVLREKGDDLRQAGAEIRLALAPTRVMGDVHALHQALGNLVENAVKYSAQAMPPRIEIGGNGAGEHYRLWVRDNGIGFDMAYHDRIFEIFRRLHTYAEYPGTGVGLALVKRAVERMGGKVWAESIPGRGSTFFMELHMVG